MPIVFEDVTGEIVSRSGDNPTVRPDSRNDAPSEDQICQMVAEHTQVLAERCARSAAD